jgi:hypothetical protein
MADLRTRYLGLELRSPLVASSSPLTGSVDGLLRLEAAGADALELNVCYVSSRPGLSYEQRSVPDPVVFERANYISTLASHRVPHPPGSPLGSS